MSYKPSRELQSTIENIILSICQTSGSELSWRKFWMAAGIMIGEAESSVVRSLCPDPPEDGVGLVEVEGDRLAGTLSDFITSCHLLIGKEQKLESPDSEVIAVLSNAIRLAREHDLLKNSRIILPGTPTE